MTRGGKRKGAGRKAETDRSHAVQVMLSVAELKWLDTLTKRYGLSRAGLLREALSHYGIGKKG